MAKTPLIFQKPFQKKTPRAATPKPKKPLTTNPAHKEVLPTEVQGSPVGSTDEARVSLALDRLGYTYRYQYALFGGGRLRGGQKVDFLVYTRPHPTPIQVKAAYWHTGVRDDIYQDQQINGSFRGRYRKVLSIDTKYTPTVDAAIAYLRQYLPSN